MGKKERGGREGDARCFITKYNLILKCRYEAARFSCRSGLASVHGRPPKRNNAKITTKARACGIDIVMCLSIKLRELKLCKKKRHGTNGGVAPTIFYYPISRTDLIVNGNQFRDAGRIAKNSQYYAFCAAP